MDISNTNTLYQNDIEMYKYQLFAEKPDLKKIRNELVNEILYNGIIIKKYTFDGTYFYCMLKIDLKRGMIKYFIDNNGQNDGETNLKYLLKIQKGAKTEIFLNSNINKNDYNLCFSLIFSNNITFDFKTSNKLIK